MPLSRVIILVQAGGCKLEFKAVSLVFDVDGRQVHIFVEELVHLEHAAARFEKIAEKRISHEGFPEPGKVPVV